MARGIAPIDNAIKIVRLLMVTTWTPLLPFAFVFFVSGEIVEFRRGVRSILTRKCMACHDSRAAGRKQMAGSPRTLQSGRDANSQAHRKGN